MPYQLWFGDKLWESLTGQDVDISVLLLILLLWGSITWGLNGTYRQRLQKKRNQSYSSTRLKALTGTIYTNGTNVPALSVLFLRKFYVFKMEYASIQRWWNFQSGHFVVMVVFVCAPTLNSSRKSLLSSAILRFISSSSLSTGRGGYFLLVLGERANSGTLWSSETVQGKEA